MATGACTATVGGASDSFDGLVTAETQERDGYRDHSAQDRKAMYANLGWAASDNVSTRFYANYLDENAELPRELTPEQYQQNPWQARPDAILGDHRNTSKQGVLRSRRRWRT